MKVYQAGPMRGLPQYNFNTFERGAHYLRFLGHEVVSPHEIDIKDGLVKFARTLRMSGVEHDPYNYVYTAVELTPKFSIEAALRRDVAAIAVAHCVSFLPGWEDSEGCQIEHQVAEWLGLPIYEHIPWVSFTHVSGPERMAA